MVPFPPEKDFPEPKDLAKRKRVRAGAASYAFEKNPDGGGVLLPPLKEEYKKNKSWWAHNVHYPWTEEPVLKEEDGVAYHFLGTAYRLIGTMKYKLDRERADQLLQIVAEMGLKSMSKEAKKWEKSIYKNEVKEDSKLRQLGIEEVEKKLDKAKERLIFIAKYHSIPENHAEALADLLPCSSTRRRRSRTSSIE